MKIQSLLAMFLLAVLPCAAQSTDIPALSGHINHMTSSQDLRINGKRIQISAETRIYLAKPPVFLRRSSPVKLSFSQFRPYIGQYVDVFGELTTPQYGLEATRIILRARVPQQVSGSGVIDALPPVLLPTPSGTDHFIRAAGYLISISDSTRSTFEKPLASSADIATNTWVRFKGLQRTDGIVIASEVFFSHNIPAPQRDAQNPGANVGPTTAASGKRQNQLTQSPTEIGPGQMSSSPEAIMQERISRIGAKLVPQYQTSLPASDQSRIDFRFKVLSENNASAQSRDATLQPDGNILISQALVDRLQNDSQIAAVLARSMACALDKLPANGRSRKARVAAENAVTAAGYVIPVLAVAGSITTSVENAYMTAYENQSERVGLWLMRDAGYDIEQAPMAWWLLAQKPGQSLDQVTLPPRTEYLYTFLGDSWPREYAAASKSSVASSTPTSAPAAQQ